MSDAGIGAEEDQRTLGAEHSREDDREEGAAASGGCHAVADGCVIGEAVGGGWLHPQKRRKRLISCHLLR